MAWVSPRTWVSGETLTAALLNAELRDQLLAAEPVGSLHYYIRAATTIETVINGFALEVNGVTPLRATYAALNTLLSGLGYPFGSGNGSTTFTLPDIQGRGLLGMASGGHADANALGDSDGLAKASRTPKLGSHTHTGPSHTHTFADTSGGESAAGPVVQSGSGINVAATPHTHDVSGTTSASGTANTGSNGSYDGAYLVAGVYAVKY